MQGGRKKILLVEDNHMNRVLVREILTLQGYDIIEAESGTDALKVLAAERPDVILMDLHLPGMDGVTATRIIKSDERIASIPVLALTASAMRGEEDKILSKGFDGYVAKPIERKKLLEAISEKIGALPESAPAPAKKPDPKSASS